MELSNYLAKKLPKRMVYHAAIRLWAFSTSGEYGNTIATEITVTEAVDRWQKNID